MLYVVATPIGNLKDITLRALDILKSVDIIAAEDTRHSKQLLDFYGINTPLISLHEHNEQQRIAELLPQLQAGKSMALISDAGTPLISDPGGHFVQALHEAKIAIIPIPGACAAISALSVSGLPAGKFVFEGFLPTENARRQRRLKELATEPRTIIFYEAPHRIVEFIEQLKLILGGERIATIARELTKTFETIHQDSLYQLHDWLLQDPMQRKGEFVIVVSGAPTVASDDQELQRILQILLAELPLKQAVTLAVQITGAKRNHLYELALKQAK